MNALELHLFELTNRQRSRGRLRPLAADDDLSDVARRHSDDMLRRRFFAHVNPEKKGPGDRIAAATRRPTQASAENLWMRSGPVSPATLDRVIEQALAQLMASPHHRQNIMYSHFTHLGIGIACTSSEVRVTQLFAQFIR